MGIQDRTTCKCVLLYNYHAACFRVEVHFAVTSPRLVSGVCHGSTIVTPTRAFHTHTRMTLRNSVIYL